MEHASCGDLSEVVQKRAADKRPLSEDEIMFWFVQVGGGGGRGGGREGRMGLLCASGGEGGREDNSIEGRVKGTEILVQITDAPAS